MRQSQRNDSMSKSKCRRKEKERKQVMMNWGGFTISSLKFWWDEWRSGKNSYLR